MKKLVYICSPYRGDYEKNAERAVGYAASAFAMGYIPIAPHIYFPQFLSDDVPGEREAALEAGLQLLLACSEIWVFGIEKPSEGMRLEMDLAAKRGIPIRDGVKILAKRGSESVRIQEQRRVCGPDGVDSDEKH